LYPSRSSVPTTNWDCKETEGEPVDGKKTRIKARDNWFLRGKARRGEEAARKVIRNVVTVIILYVVRGTPVLQGM
jgi:hypothetical protein